jgi:murein DD-endopeptidase MepM/ murein hydrolase activator NlpD
MQGRRAACGTVADAMARRPFGHGPVAWVLKRLLVVAAVLALGTWLMLLVDRRTLPGLRVGQAEFPRTSDPAHTLVPWADGFAAGVIEIRTGPNLTRAQRSALGAQLDPAPLAAHLLALGHSGNPLVDLATFWDVWMRGRDVPWIPVVDRIALGRYVQAIRRNVERPPVAGATDDQGWSIAGVPGITLDTVETVAAIEHALRTGGTVVDVPLRQVPAPQALAIGSPDAVLYDDEHDEGESADVYDSGTLLPARFAEALSRARPNSWLPSRGKEPLAPPYEKYGQGPRKVAMPWGPAAELADNIGLGVVQTVGRLLHAGPRDTWRDAAGRRSEPDMLWPVPGGRLWRRFGYVRKGEFRDKLHRGIDIGAPVGTPIMAVNDGIVAYSDNGVNGYGNLLLIVHVDGSTTFSAHCSAIYVFAGQKVARGQIVGEVGETGLARGAHVHFEYQVAGTPIDPLPRFALK